MPALVAIHPDGKKVVRQVRKMDFAVAKELIGNGCDLIQSVRVRYGGKIRDCWLDEEGFSRPNPVNPHIKRLVEDAYPMYRGGVQDFVGVGVVYIAGDTSDKSDPAEAF